MSSNGYGSGESRIGRYMRRGRIVAGTAILMAVCAGAVFVSVHVIAQRADAVAGPAPAPRSVVASTILRASDGYVVTRRFPGQVEPRQSVDLSFEAGGTIDAIAREEGEAVAAGEVVARLDTRLLRAERDRLAASRAAVSAQAELARRTTRRQARLQDDGFASQQALDRASLGLAELTARIAEIDAALAELDVRLDKAVIRAPFDGRVAGRFVDAGVTVSAGAPVIVLLEDGPPVFRVGIDPALADRLKVGGEMRVDIRGVSHPARLTALRPDLDPASRTRTALFALRQGEVPFRETGYLEMEQRIEGSGFAVPVAALHEGVRGLWTVFVLTSAGDGLYDVGLEAVEIVHADAGTAFVQGTLADGARIVADGTHRVAPGERVRLSAGDA